MSHLNWSIFIFSFGSYSAWVIQVVPDMALVSSNLIIDCLGGFPNVLFLAAIACQAVYTVFTLAVEVASYLIDSIVSGNMVCSVYSVTRDALFLSHISTW